MTCHNCQISCNPFGKHRNGLKRFRCRQCRKTFTEPHATPLNEMRLPFDKAISILKLLVEGMSVRSIERVTQVHRDTILRLLVVAGQRCMILLDEKMRNLKLKHVQCDELWTFCFKKQKQVRRDDPAEFGDQWFFVAIDEETKLIPCYIIGKRTRETTLHFLAALKAAVSEDRFQITTDGFHFYERGVENVFAGQTDFAQLIKLYGDYGQFGQERYSPGRITEVISKIRDGRPDPDHISTSHVERQNLTCRMAMRRLTRLTNAFSKKLENLKAAAALHFAYYNFCRVHQSLRITPAMEAGLTNRVWTLADLFC